MDMILIDIPDIKGNSTFTSHKDKIILMSYSHGVSIQMRDDPANTERTSGRPTVSEMTFQKLVDQATPQLYSACVTGKKLGTATVFIGRNENDKFMELLKYELSNAMVSQIQTSGSGGDAADSFSLNFTGIKTFFTQQNADSTKKGVADWGYDRSTNAAL